MTPLYILNRYSDDVRRQRATPDEIRAVIDGRSSDRLARIELDDEGDIVAYPLDGDELSALGSELETEMTVRLRDLLDAAADLARKTRGLSGVSTSIFGVLSIWVGDAPGADRIVTAWAEERGYEVRRSSPPTTGRRWYPDATVRAHGADIARLIWPDVEVNTERAVEAEIATVSAERETAARELEAF